VNVRKVSITTFFKGRVVVYSTIRVAAQRSDWICIVGDGKIARRPGFEPLGDITVPVWWVQVGVFLRRQAWWQPSQGELPPRWALFELGIAAIGMEIVKGHWE